MNYGLLSLVPLLASLAVQPTPARPSNALYWVFLNKGAGKKPLTKEESQRMQDAHVGNLGKLWEQGRALTAGPLGDDGFIRGIVILAVKTPQEVADCFREDPFVQNDHLAVESYRWLADGKRLHKPHKPFKMAQYTLGIVKKGPDWQPLKGDVKADTLEKILGAIRTLTRSHDLAVSGPLLDANDFVGILLFRISDQEKIKQELDSDPAIRTGRVVVELHPQWLAEGVLD